MPDDDLRALFDPIAALLAARPRYRVIPEQTYTPDPLPGDPAPEPVVIPERLELYVDPDELPTELQDDAGGSSLNKRVATVSSALAWMWDRQQIRTVSGRVEIVGIHLSGSHADYTLEWDTTPDKVPTGGDVQMLPTNTSGIFFAAWMSGQILPGSESLDGATIRVTFNSTVAIDPDDPVIALTKGMYLFIPPYEP